jgi:hypothetical protein
MTIALPIITLFAGVFLGAWFNNFLKRPKLVITGGSGGGGPSPGHHWNSLRLTNRPGLLGVTLRRTEILGKRLFGHVEKGWTVERIPASDCSATLFEKGTNLHVAPLWWRSTTNPNDVQQVVTIPSGGSWDLLLFARLNSEPGNYFVFAPGSVGAFGPRLPTSEPKFDDTRSFVIKVRFDYGRRTKTIECTMRKELNGTLTFLMNGGGSAF